MSEKGVTSTTEDKIPWRTLSITLMIVSSEAMASNIILPFVTDICSNVFDVSDSNIGIASGMLIGVFAFCAFLSSPILGYLSDLKGRKKVIILGISTNIICILLFPLSPNIWVALFSRAFAGATNSNISIVKAVITDITKGKARSLAFAYQGSTFTLTRAVSSAMSGLLVGILIPGIPIFDSNDYILACTAAALYNTLTLIFVIFLLPESLKRTNSSQKPKEEKEDVEIEMSLISSEDGRSGVGEDDDDIDGDKRRGNVGDEGEIRNVDSEENGKKELSFDTENEKLLSASMVDDIDPIIVSDDIELEDQQRDTRNVLRRCSTSVAQFIAKSPFIQGIGSIFSDKTTRKVTILYAVNSFCNGGIFLALTLYYALPIENHGLGFSPSEIGIAFLYFSIMGVVIQLLFFSRVVDKLRLINTYLMGISCLAFGTLITPLPNLIYRFSYLRVIDHDQSYYHYNSTLTTTTTTYYENYYLNETTSLSMHDDGYSSSASIYSSASSILQQSSTSWPHTVYEIDYILCWVFVCISSLFVGAGLLFAINIINTMFSNVTSCPLQGLMQGSYQSMGAIVRSVAPTVVGAIFTFAIYIHFPLLLFGFLFFLYVCCFFFCLSFSKAEKDRCNGDVEKSTIVVDDGDDDRSGNLRSVDRDESSLFVIDDDDDEDVERVHIEDFHRGDGSALHSSFVHLDDGDLVNTVTVESLDLPPQISIDEKL